MPKLLQVEVDDKPMGKATGIVKFTSGLGDRGSTQCVISEGSPLAMGPQNPILGKGFIAASSTEMQGNCLNYQVLETLPSNTNWVNFDQKTIQSYKWTERKGREAVDSEQN